MDDGGGGGQVTVAASYSVPLSENVGFRFVHTLRYTGLWPGMFGRNLFRLGRMVSECIVSLRPLKIQQDTSA